MKVIGLTGSIGSGKSTVANIMRQMGVAILCADASAKKVVKKGAPAYKKIIKAFGQKVVNKDKTLNRTRLGEIVFSSEAKRKLLNSIVHPEVIAELKREIDRMASLQRKVVVLDIPLLYEEGLEILCHKVVVVYATETMMEKRIFLRDNLSKDEIRKRITAQLPIEEKKKRADYVIDNSADLAKTQSQVEWVLREIMIDAKE